MKASLHPRPIFQAFPGLDGVLPWQQLAELPTPLESHQIAGRHVWVKRDDLSAPLYGGNKVRKLEFILAQAKAAGQTRVITFGATGTHHGLATALFCRQLGLQCEVLLFDQPDSPHVRENRQALARAGAVCTECGGLTRTVARFYLHPARLRRDTMFLFAGGSGVAGTLAFINAALELNEQLQGDEMQRLYVACSSGSTLAGLTLGFALADKPVRVIGVQVADSKLGPFEACTVGTVQALMRKTVRCLRKNGMAWEGDLPSVHLNPAYLGEGYGFSTKAASAAAEQFQDVVGVPLDTTYTAKAFAALLDDSEPGGVGFWNTLSSVKG